MHYPEDYGMPRVSMRGVNGGSLMEQALEALVEKRVQEALDKVTRKENDKLKRALQENERLRQERADLRNKVAAFQPGLADEIGKRFMDSVRIGDVFYIRKRECVVIALPDSDTEGDERNKPALGDVHVRLKLKKKPKKGESPWTKQVYVVPVRKLADSTRLRTEIEADPRNGERTHGLNSYESIWA